MRTYVELLRALGSWSPGVHVFGGIAEDALLHGRLSRPHEDLDVVVYRDEVARRVEQARSIGFGTFHLRLDARPGVPLVVGSIMDGVNLEYVIFDRWDDGRVSFDVPVPDGYRRVWMPERAFDHPPSRLESVEVRTVSPLALLHIRAGVAETFGGFRPKDRRGQAALTARFFPEAPHALLAPRVDRIDADGARMEEAPRAASARPRA